jgi:hypothetical protein
MTMIRRLLVASLIVFATVHGATQAPSALHLVVNSYGIGPPVFIAPLATPATDLLLVGEPAVFQLHVTVVNTGEARRVLTTPRQTLDMIVRSFPDKRTIDIPRPAVSGPVRAFGVSRTPVTWDAQMPLAAGESLEWTVDLQLHSVPPGVYMLEVILPASDDNGAEILRRAPWVGLEIRDLQGDQMAAEIAIRAAARRVHERRLAEALEIAADATVRFPDSVVLHVTVGNIYEQLGRRTDASRSYSRALTVAKTGQEYPMPLWPHDARETIRFITSKIAQLR